MALERLSLLLRPSGRYTFLANSLLGDRAAAAAMRESNLVISSKFEKTSMVPSSEIGLLSDYIDLMFWEALVLQIAFLIIARWGSDKRRAISEPHGICRVRRDVRTH